MNAHFKNCISKATGAKEVYEIEVIQNLWSGYGKIIRLGLTGCSLKTVIVKHVCIPKQENHPRGWNANFSHLRKIKSYKIETAWYRNWSRFCTENCRIPNCLDIVLLGDEVLIILEDLDASGYEKRKTEVSWKEMQLCLKWMANFHAVFLNDKPKDLWKIGTYWNWKQDQMNWKYWKILT